MFKVNNRNIDWLHLFRVKDEHYKASNIVDPMFLLLTINTFSILCHVMLMVPFYTPWKYQKISVWFSVLIGYKKKPWNGLTRTAKFGYEQPLEYKS